MTERKQRAGLAVVLAVSAAALVLSAAAWIEPPSNDMPVARPEAADKLRHVLRINGNDNQDEVAFDHKEHQERLGGAEGCADCHHVSRPKDFNTPSFQCHAQMNRAAAIFNHDFHEARLGGQEACVRCHDLNQVKSKETAIDCSHCHAADMGMKTAAGARFDFMAPGYRDATHGLCVSCHQKQAEALGRPELAECDTCHRRVHHDKDER